MDLCGETWYFQYSPYVYYNEHCILLNGKHVPMKIERKTFARLLAFVERLPPLLYRVYADLPSWGARFFPTTISRRVLRASYGQSAGREIHLL